MFFKTGYLKKIIRNGYEILLQYPKKGISNKTFYTPVQ